MDNVGTVKGGLFFSGCHAYIRDRNRQFSPVQFEFTETSSFFQIEAYRMEDNTMKRLWKSRCVDLILPATWRPRQVLDPARFLYFENQRPLYCPGRFYWLWRAWDLRVVCAIGTRLFFHWLCCHVRVGYRDTVSPGRENSRCLAHRHGSCSTIGNHFVPLDPAMEET
jgi:hypothetical protein